jgi:hypothetical protein
VPYAVVQDVPASWEQYARFADALAETPSGLILHVAGPTDEGFRIIGVWESEDAWLRFAAERLAPAASDDRPPSAPAVLRVLHTAHLIYGRKEQDDA